MFGGALEFDGTDDAVRLPYRDALPLGHQGLHGVAVVPLHATTGEQPLLWMGGVGGTQPQVWLRGEPASDRIQGLITAGTAPSAPRSASVRTTGAYNDGQLAPSGAAPQRRPAAAHAWTRCSTVAPRRPGFGQPQLALRRAHRPEAGQPGPVHRRDRRGTGLRRALSDAELSGVRTGKAPSRPAGAGAAAGPGARSGAKD